MRPPNVLIRWSAITTLVLGVGLACAADDVIIDINPGGDSLQFSVPWDSINEQVDTLIVDGDTVILIIVDTVIAPTDTVFQIVTDTVVDSISGDTTFVSLTDTIVHFDTVIVTRTDTVIRVDTIIQVDTVITPPPSLDFGVEILRLVPGESKQVEVTVTNALGFPVPTTALTWLTGNAQVASVNESGVVTGHNEGATSVFAIADAAGLSASLPVEVNATLRPPPPPPGEGLVFHSDWSTAVGFSDAAKRDTDKAFPWQVTKGDNAAFEIVPAAGLGFPANMVNVTETSNLDSNDCTTNCGSTAPFTGVRIHSDTCTQCLPVPAIGGDLYYRVYRRVDTPDWYISNRGDNLNHQTQDGPGTGAKTTWQFETWSRSDGTWMPEWYINDQSVGALYRRYVLPVPLQKGIVYRFEWRVHRTDTDKIWMEARVYDADDNLLYDVGDWKRKNGVDTMENHAEFTIPNINWLKGLQFGSNGWSVVPSASYVAWREGGLCIRTDTWCGAYAGGI